MSIFVSSTLGSKEEGEMTEAELKQQLTAVEEQLAEMRQLIVEARKGYWNRTLAIDWHDRADKALSAAPKRGRVLFQGEGFFARVPPDSVGMWHCVDGTVTVDFLRDIAAKDDQLLTVTVREAE